MRKKLKDNQSLIITHWSLVIGRWVVLVLFMLQACSRGDKHEEDTYTCPMHPTVVQHLPGNCPVCGMELVRKTKPGEEVIITEDLTGLTKSPNQVITSTIKTIRGEYKTVAASVAVTGIVTYDTRNAIKISARIAGRLEKVYVTTLFQPIAKGQKLAEIYSAELVTAQRELLYLLEHDAENNDLIASVKNKLSQMGCSASQIMTLLNTKKIKNTFPLYSTFSGYLINAESQAPSAATDSNTNGDMNTTQPVTSSAGTENSTMLLREGKYVSIGEPLFNIVNTEALRIELDLPVSKTGEIKTGDEIELDLGENKTYKGRVDFTEPFFDTNKGFIKVRMYTKKLNLPVGQFVHGTIKVKPRASLWVPREAVVDLGNDEIVFIKEHDVFKPKKIIAGIHTDRLVEIKSGIVSSDELAANGQFLVDSESFIKLTK